MSREAIKDKNFNILGYIETMSGGQLKAMDKNYLTLGYFDPKRNITQDKNYQKIAEGNVLAALIFNKR